jgi:hypothetical protein
MRITLCKPGVSFLFPLLIVVFCEKNRLAFRRMKIDMKVFILKLTNRRID